MELREDDLIRITKKPSTEGAMPKTFEARVSWIEIWDGFLYVGYVPDSCQQGLWGAFRYYPQGANRPAFAVDVEVIGHLEPRKYN